MRPAATMHRSVVCKAVLGSARLRGRGGQVHLAPWKTQGGPSSGCPLVSCNHRAIMFHFRKEEENLYTILAVKPSAKSKDVKKAYYKMAKKYHPDFLQGEGISDKEREQASEMFKKISKAYEVLSNPVSRQAYDIENNFNDGRDGQASFDQTIYED